MTSVRTALGLLAGVVLLAGCSSAVVGRGSESAPADLPSSSTATPSASPSASGSVTPSAAPGSPQALAANLEKIALNTSDFDSGYTMKLIPGGDQVKGQVTLDNCGYAFTTEAHRAVRRQYALVDSDDEDQGLSNELVAYDTAASATLALAQWHAAADTCPKTPVSSGVAGEPDVTVRVSRNDLDAAGLPVAHSAVTVESITDDTGTFYEATVIQLRGRYLDAVYADQDDAFDAQDLAGVLSLALVTGSRLVDLK